MLSLDLSEWLLGQGALVFQSELIVWNHPACRAFAHAIVHVHLVCKQDDADYEMTPAERAFAEEQAKRVC